MLSSSCGVYKFILIIVISFLALAEVVISFSFFDEWFEGDKDYSEECGEGYEDPIIKVCYVGYTDTIATFESGKCGECSVYGCRNKPEDIETEADNKEYRYHCEGCQRWCGIETTSSSVEEPVKVTEEEKVSVKWYHWLISIPLFLLICVLGLKAVGRCARCNFYIFPCSDNE